MICCYTQLVGNLSKGLLEPPTLTGSAHFTFLSSGFVQIFSEIVSKTIKKLPVDEEAFVTGSSENL